MRRYLIFLLIALTLMLLSAFCALDAPQQTSTRIPTATTAPEYGPTQYHFAPVRPYVTVVATPKGWAD